jgi:trk system potassium uptake protein TrkA
MKAIIVGCGRVGATLTVRLLGQGHDIRVIDRDIDTRTVLPSAMADRFYHGNGFSRSVLEAAGIADVDALVAVTSADNTNIVASRVAKEAYRVPMVFARIYDPVHADLYRQMGIPTVSTVSWAVHEFTRMLLHRHLAAEMSFGAGETLLVRSSIPAYLAGRPLAELEVGGQIRCVEVTRRGRSAVADATTLAEDGDIVTFAVGAESLELLRSFIDLKVGP